MNATHLTLPILAARRFHRAAAGLDLAHADVGAALAYHGYAQIDPINVCGRMHDLMLRNRVAGYRENDLLRHLYGADFAAAEKPLPPSRRAAFEHYLPGAGILVAFPLEAWPHLQSHMEERRRQTSGYAKRLTPSESKLAARILAEIAERGPLSSDDIEHDERSRSAWGTRGSMAKIVLEKLFFHGRVLITTRRNFRRIYDLPERVIPSSLLNAPRPSDTETARWLVATKLRQRRLVALKKTELPHIADLVQPLRVEGCPALFCLQTDVTLLDEVQTRASEDSITASSKKDSDSPRLLAPLDPLIYDRRITRALWNFDYTWEVYTPPAKRVRGYYALPVLAGTDIIGHIDPKADRDARRLRIVTKQIPRAHTRPTTAAAKTLAAFLNLR